MKKILFADSECVPFMKTGGLADVVGALPKALNKEEFDVRVILPSYTCIPWEYRSKFQYVHHFYMDMGQLNFAPHVGIMKYEYEGITYYFVDNEDYFKTDKPYLSTLYDIERFIFFSKSVLAIMPEIDDDLIKDTTEFDTIEDWKKDIKEKMETQSEATAAAQFENHLMQKLIDTAEGVIPKCMFDKRVDQLISEFERNLKQQNMSVEIYLQYTGMDMDSFRETFQERAENEVKLRLALEKIADLENLIPTQDEINDGLKEIAEFNKITVEDIKHRIDMDAYITDLKAVKAVNFVKDNAVIDNTIVEEKESEEASED